MDLPVFVYLYSMSVSKNSSNLLSFVGTCSYWNLHDIFISDDMDVAVR